MIPINAKVVFDNLYSRATCCLNSIGLFLSHFKSNDVPLKLSVMDPTCLINNGRDGKGVFIYLLYFLKVVKKNCFLLKTVFI